MLSLTNTLTRSVERIAPEPGRVLTLYACGPTVYRTAHVGNLRTFLLSDLIRRALAYRAVEVRAVQNITDVGHLSDDRFERGEDKVLAAAAVEGRSADEIAEHYTQRYLGDAAAIGLLPFDAYPRASAHVPQMVALIERLEAAGYAYEAPQAVYFDVRRFRGYGQLSGNDLSQLQAGHRTDGGAAAVDAAKRFHGDFALWRKAGEERQVAWDSPWGRGFPGWHIECSAMALEHLGPRIDVHVGGVDLQFPHHEAEIAQSDGAVGHRVVGVWVHGEHLLAEGRKMAKSTGNVVDVAAIRAAGIDPLAFRLLCLQARYRTQANLTWEALHAADRTLERLRSKAGSLGAADPGAVDRPRGGAADLEDRFVAAIEDDLDTPGALVVVHAVASGEGDAAQVAPPARAALLERWDRVLGLRLRDAAALGQLPDGAARLLARRDDARAARDFALADALRDELAAIGVDVRDTPEGTAWTRRA